MRPMPWQRDLIVVCADEDMLVLVRTMLLKRRGSLAIRPIKVDESDFRKDVLHDSSAPDTVAGLLRPFLRTHHRAIVLRDLEGSGFDDAAELESALRTTLERNGWDKERLEIVVLEPELEAWLRFRSSHMAQLVRKNKRLRRQPMPNFSQTVGRIIENRGGEENLKPKRPKEVFKDVLDTYRIPWSASLYEQLAVAESLNDCSVPSFCKLLSTLRAWFPAGT